MEPYLDFIGFIAYDLHGSWDTDVKVLGEFSELDVTHVHIDQQSIGSVVRPQTDITEIYRNLKPLWFDGVDPAKINMGLVYYGRTYKFADSSCGTMNACQFSGPGAAGECTAFEGVLSNREIRDMIKENCYQTYLNRTAMVKYMTYDGDSWVGYDNEETLAMKEDFANLMCLGGLIIWSVDFDADTGGNIGRGSGLYSDLVWVSPEVWTSENPKVVCEFPCTIVLPPFTEVSQTTDYPLVTVTQSGSTTKITRPLMIVSVWWISTMVISASSATVKSSVTLYTTSSWPAFTVIDQFGSTIVTSATITRRPPPTAISSAIPEITFVSGLPPRPTITPYATPCATAPGLCNPGEDDNSDDEDDDRDGSGAGGGGGCKGSDCDPGNCGGSCGGCKLGLICDLCFGLDCLACVGLDCFSCKGPLCEICNGDSCLGCKGSQCSTCKGEHCASCTKGNCCIGSKCTSGTCSDLQCLIGSETDPTEKEVEENEDPEHNICEPFELPDDPSNPGGGDSDNLQVNSHDFQAMVMNFGWQESHKARLNILIRIEAKANCRWNMNKDECNKQLLQIVDGCDQEGTNDKQGGILENNCLIWRVDPEFNSNSEPPPPPQEPEPEPQPEIPERKVPETKNGHTPKYDIFTFDLAIRDPSGLPVSVSRALQHTTSTWCAPWRVDGRLKMLSYLRCLTRSRALTKCLGTRATT